ncbi:MAG: RtcB family protein [Ruminococcaceae bacterium]|nr:RtcB family protein [Oscillospiraceae bacterium]
MAYDLMIYTDNVEPAAVNQIYNLMTQPPFRGSKVRIMPDVHVGSGCVVGFTATMGDKVIPNVIGVDIGCGMLTVELGKADVYPAALDGFIRAQIPAGSALHKDYGDVDFVKKLRCFGELRDTDRVFRSMGTLGGGNHFIELDRDEEGNTYLVIHSGSRNLGTQVAKYYQKKAVDLCKNDPARSKIPADYCYLQGAEAEDYLHDMRICQEFAVRNRLTMAERILKHLGISKATRFETMHNFIDEENIIRKGAIPAHRGQKVLIPMNMRDGCLIAEGRGNPDWNCSAPHGAGRLVSRAEAKELFTVEEYQAAMAGIYTTSANRSTIDESPMAYKPMAQILGLIGPTVTVLKVIKPIYNFKAGN